MFRLSLRFYNFSLCHHFNIFFSWKYNRDFAYIKEIPPGKILQGRWVKSGASFYGETSFCSRFYCNISEIVRNTKIRLNVSLLTRSFAAISFYITFLTNEIGYSYHILTGNTILILETNWLAYLLTKNSR